MSFIFTLRLDLEFSDTLCIFVIVVVTYLTMLPKRKIRSFVAATWVCMGSNVAQGGWLHRDGGVLVEEKGSPSLGFTRLPSHHHAVIFLGSYQVFISWFRPIHGYDQFRHAHDYVPILFAELLRTEYATEAQCIEEVDHHFTNGKNASQLFRHSPWHSPHGRFKMITFLLNRSRSW